MSPLIYTLVVVSATLASVSPADGAPAVQRVAGANRYETAAAASRAGFSPGVAVAFVATGADYPDALAAGPAAIAGRGPVLLTTRDALPSATATELDRLRPGRIVVVGGASAVSDAVLDELRSHTAGDVTRIAGADRYDTAARLSAATFDPGVGAVFVATGTGFADGLAGGAAAGFAGGPVLLVTPSSIPSVTSTELRRLAPGSITVLGGPAAVAPEVEQQLHDDSGTVRRAAGGDRYATAAAVSAATFPAPRPTVVLATGLAFADALAGGALAGATAAPVLLVPGNCVTRETQAELDRLQPSTIMVLGGTQAVTPEAEQLRPCATFADARVRLTQVATLDQPLALATRAGDAALYVAEKTGRVRAIRSGAVDATPVLDLAGSVATGSEQGLLGLAFSPDGALLYVDYTDRAGDTHVVEFRMAGGRADAATRRELLFVDQPFANHNGGELIFGPDAMLYVGLGDGGSSNDPQNNAQRLDTLLGKLLRIDPRPSGGQPYTIPADNPFVSTQGARRELWTVGLRNPWRFSFDRATGDVWIGDVGQNRREEVDFRSAGTAAGSNFGWARLEGTLTVSGSPPAGAVPPILEYDTADPNCAVTGGYVYRGGRIAGFGGAYVYGDFCGGRVLAARQESGRIVERRDLDLPVPQLSSFGEDGGGELYALSLSGGLFRLDPA